MDLMSARIFSCGRWPRHNTIGLERTSAELLAGTLFRDGGDRMGTPSVGAADDAFRSAPRLGQSIGSLVPTSNQGPSYFLTYVLVARFTHFISSEPSLIAHKVTGKVDTEHTQIPLRTRYSSEPFSDQA